MSKGRNNSLAKQIGEHLVCAELGRLGLIATPFSGNVPTFDILAADERCKTVPIQVKASRCESWRSDARKWMNLTLDPETKMQVMHGEQHLETADLIYVHVAIAPLESKTKDRFFVLTQKQLQAAAIKCYSKWMDGIGWKRPRIQDCYDCRYHIRDVENYENNWKLVTERLTPSAAEIDDIERIQLAAEVTS